MRRIRVAIVGGGIIGLATARELLDQQPGAEVTVFEKEDKLASHQTGRNSGVVHAGLYYEPGSLKSRLCRRGSALLKDFAEDKNVAYQECGKIVVAQTEKERARLRNIFAKAQVNGAADVELISGSKIQEIEPAAVGIEAIYSPRTAIVNFSEIAQELGNDVIRAGGEIRLGEKVTGMEENTSPAGFEKVRIVTQSGSENFDLVISCAGLQADRVARTYGEGASPRVVPFFGDYFMLAREQADLVRGLIYPVPDPKYPFLGVHITRRVDGSVMVGPNAFLSLGREVYRHGGMSIKDLAEVVGFGGFWRFAARNLPAALREMRTVVSKRAFINEAKRYMPEIELSQVTPGPRGVRAQAMHDDGSLVDDFYITGNSRVVHVRNAPSPAATSSLAIAEYLVAEVLSRASIGR